MQFKANGNGLQKLLGIVIVSSALAGCGGSSSDSSASSASSTSSSATSSTSSTTNTVATVALSSPDYVVNATSTAIVTIYRSGSTSGTATVGYTTTNGTATAGADYVATSGAVTWQDGDSSAKTVIVPVTTAASGKNFSISLTNVQGQATFGSPSSAVIQVATVASAVSSSSGGASSSSSGSTTAATSSSSSGATSATGTATLSWSAPTENTNGTALTNLAGYNIYYGTSSSAMTNKISITTVGMLTYVIDNMTSGNWYFAITSVNAAGVESVLTTTVETSI